MKLKLIILIISSFTFAYSQDIPSYKISVTPSAYIINKKEKLDFLINISGYGKLENTKLLIYSDYNVKINDKENNLCYQTLTSEIFEDEKINKPSYGISPTGIEITPLKHSLKTNKTGEHTVYIILTYTADDKKFYTDRITFDFYVNTWLDNNQTWLIISGTILALLGLFDFRSIFKRQRRKRTN